ncbi:LysR family transcriptional regulator [Robbsia sp. Bb-Pol-6]|uniref:LysR family transcriptional regulator n=1 Tax=Robbsia betulipollinis TaxID=2981849 RepID=A0ABT3ZIJ7_9BURK|nr:LysR family transcriptional regulator [Robbsia betulipollinis]MCY0386242.1 LysR family transcriptional regulator [Robbsia betulipollinis]
MVVFSRFTGYFVAVAQFGSIRKAAEALHVSASAIDRQILQAEAEIGTPLFERLAHGLRPTAAGEIFLKEVRGWQKAYRRARVQVDDLKGLKRGHVEVAIIDALTEGMVADAIGRLTADHPGLTVGIQVLDNEDIARSVAAGDVDFGLLLQSASTTDLEIRATAAAPLGVAFPPGHPLQASSAVRVSHTLDFKPILPGPPLVISEQVHALYRRQGMDATAFMSCNNTQMIRSLVRQGVGVGVLCWLDVAADVAHGRLDFRPLRDMKLAPLTLQLCVAARRQLSHGAREAIRYLEAGMADEAYR